MKITFVDFGPDIASSRLRAKIPQAELAKLGYERGQDVLVYGKHFIGDQILGHFKRLVYDICDDHFAHPELGPYYRKHAGMADLITCNSEFMRQRIMEETGRQAHVIPEPYESDESEPNIGPELYWFGHKSNYPDMERLLPSLKHPVKILTNPDWTREKHLEQMAKPCIIVIPTGKSLAKSENRMVEGIRHGKYVCAEDLPAYRPFDQFFPLGKIPDHVDSVLNGEQAEERIRAAQDYIRARYSPEAIGKRWEEVISGNLDIC